MKAREITCNFCGYIGLLKFDPNQTYTCPCCATKVIRETCAICNAPMTHNGVWSFDGRVRISTKINHQAQEIDFAIDIFAFEKERFNICRVCVMNAIYDHLTDANRAE